jgi:hypothetical protein
MKNIITLTIICIVMQSCNSQKKDLAKITFTEKQDTFFGDIPNEYGATQNQSDFIAFNKNNIAIKKQWISASFMMIKTKMAMIDI